MKVKRIKVKGHYRIVERDEKGKFQHVEKWKPQLLLKHKGGITENEP